MLHGMKWQVPKPFYKGSAHSAGTLTFLAGKLNEKLAELLEEQM